MTIVRTDLGDTRESARRIRVEATGFMSQTNVQKALEAVAGVAFVSATAISVVNSPYVVPSSVNYLYVDSSGGAVAITLAAASARAGVPLVVKDIAGSGATNNITLTPNGAETIDGLAALVINADFGGYRLNPRSGVGYTVSP